MRLPEHCLLGRSPRRGLLQERPRGPNSFDDQESRAAKCKSEPRRVFCRKGLSSGRLGSQSDQNVIRCFRATSEEIEYQVCIHTYVILYHITIICTLEYECSFLALRHFFLFGPRVFFSCSRLRGTQETRMDLARKFGRWPRSVARALGVQSGKSPRGGIPST